MENKVKEKVVKEELNYGYHGKVYTEKTDVLYFSAENSLNKFQNALLGDFNSAGGYKIAEDVLKKLVDIKKVVVKKENEVLHLKSETTLKAFNFTVITGNAPNNKLFAQLSVVEKVLGVEEDKAILTTHVVYYIDVDDAFFEAKYKKAFNVVLSADGGKEDNDKILADILAKIKFGNNVYKRYLIENKLKDKIYVEKMIKILMQTQEGKRLLSAYQILLNKSGLLPTNKDYYRTLKQMLDGVIEKNKENLSNETKVLVNRLRDVYVKANTMTIDAIVNQEKAKEKPASAAAKGGPSKGGSDGGKSGGGGGKSGGGGGGAKKPEAKKSSSSPYIKTQAKVAEKEKLEQKVLKEGKPKEEEHKPEIKDKVMFSVLVNEVIDNTPSLLKTGKKEEPVIKENKVVSKQNRIDLKIEKEM